MTYWSLFESSTSTTFDDTTSPIFFSERTMFIFTNDQSEARTYEVTLEVGIEDW